MQTRRNRFPFSFGDGPANLIEVKSENPLLSRGGPHATMACEAIVWLVG